uniref:Uncharacterized protein n=1 Tax=Macrostomum lignano TaxID=282301 RepID=A0A1I8HVC5_9PLAT
MNRRSFSENMDKKFLSWSEVEAGRMRARLQRRRRPLGEVELPDSVPTELEESKMAATAAASVSLCLSIHCQDAQAAGRISSAEDQPIVGYRLALHQTSPGSISLTTPEVLTDSPKEESPLLSHSPQAATTSVIRERRRERRLFQSGSQQQQQQTARHRRRPMPSQSLASLQQQIRSQQQQQQYLEVKTAQSQILPREQLFAVSAAVSVSPAAGRATNAGGKSDATVAAPSAAAPSNSASLQQLPPPSATSQQQPPPKPRLRCIGKPLNTSTAAPSTAEVQHTRQQTESRYKFPDALF